MIKRLAKTLKTIMLDILFDFYHIISIPSKFNSSNAILSVSRIDLVWIYNSLAIKGKRVAFCSMIRRTRIVWFLSWLFWLKAWPILIFWQICRERIKESTEPSNYRKHQNNKHMHLYYLVYELFHKMYNDFTGILMSHIKIYE